MENRWILIIALIVLACMPLQVMAYDNIEAHPLINVLAVDYFEKVLLPGDPLLKNTLFNAEPVQGFDWNYKDHGRVKIGPRSYISNINSKPMKEWIKDGGYSADEPEYTMALVHFYDPTKAKPYLTDQQFLVEFGNLFFEDFQNPRISAVDWAFDRDRTDLMYFTQDYSWNDALFYYSLALADDSHDNEFYGRAWRAVGETMHLISDMTVPAHVRNDGHAWSDPYEESVKGREVIDYKDGNPLDLNYDSGTLEELMIRIATEVNENFFSADTIPCRIINSSGIVDVEKYSQPSLKGLSLDADGYYHSPTGIKLAHEHVWNGRYSSAYIRQLDGEVLDDQRSVLIPTAIRASAEVLDRFLPRFEARLSVEKYLPDDLDDDMYILHATLTRVPTEQDAWKDEDLLVRNGAYLIEEPPDGEKTEWELLLEDAISFNDFTAFYEFKPGTIIQMKYDLGGYVIMSNKVVIPRTTTSPPEQDWTRKGTAEDACVAAGGQWIDGRCYTDTIREHSGEAGYFD
jgi:hypothetical protein